MPIPESESRAVEASAGAAVLSSSADVVAITSALDEYIRLRETGQKLDRTVFLARHADIAGELCAYLDGLDLLLSARGDLLSSGFEDDCDNALAPATRLGDYRIIREVGRGGMGAVYEAEQLSLGRRVALKVLPHAAALDARARQRFHLEAQAVALLQHEHIVPVYGVGCEEGVHYYAMPLIDGLSLADVIEQHLARRAPLERQSLEADEAFPRVHDNAASPPRGVRGAFRFGYEQLGTALTGSDTSPQGQWRLAWRVASACASPSRDDDRLVAWYGVQAARALQHAHEAGVIHRDIKPSNLLVDSRDHLWVTDFGLARLIDEDPHLSRSGDLIGTLRYMSPEQVRGARHEIDPRTDIYALGLTLYELLTLRPAFDAADRQELFRHILQDEPVAPRRIDPSISRDLETIVLKATAKEPASRYDSAGELADDLRLFLDDQPIRARRPNIRERAARLARRHRTVMVTAASVLLVALAISTVLLWQAKSRTDRALDAHREALLKMRLAYEGSFTTIDQMTEAFTNPGGHQEPQRGAEADRAYRLAIAYYTPIARTPRADELVSEVAARASRRAGYFRMILGDSNGRADYEHAIRSFETLANRHPDFVWLRTRLIETLREYAHRLSRSGDPDAAAAPFRRAVQLALDQIGRKEWEPPCFHKALIDPFNGLALDLVARREVDAADVAIAIRLAEQAALWESTDWPHWPQSHRALGILGVAYCRAGEWARAASAFESAMAANGGGDVRDWFFVAIARRQLGDLAGARHWYDRAVSWMVQHDSEARASELLGFRAEADEALRSAPAFRPVAVRVATDDLARSPALARMKTAQQGPRDENSDKDR
jgi:serine/threonine protein kinase